MLVAFAVRRHEYDVPVTHAALGYDMVGERLYVGTASLQHGHFQTAVVADVNMERRLREVMVRVEFLRQAFRKLAGSMIVNIAQGRDTVVPARQFEV